MNQQQQAPGARRITDAEIEIGAQHAADNFRLQAKHHNEKIDQAEKQAAEMAAAAPPTLLAGPR